MPLSPRRLVARLAARSLFPMALGLLPALATAESDDALLVSPGSPILDGLETMPAGPDPSVLFEAREIFRLAHRNDAVAAIDRHLGRVAAARAARAPEPPVHTIGDILHAPVEAPQDAAAPSASKAADWAGADRAGVERARRWLREIGCERRGVCKESASVSFLRDPRLMPVLAGFALGVVVALPLGLLRRFRVREALGATLALAGLGVAVLFGTQAANDAGLVLIVALAYAVLVVPPYLLALAVTLGLMKRGLPDRTPRTAAEAPVE